MRCRCCAPTRSSASGRPAARWARRPISLAILLEEEGLYDRALIYATDINEVTLRQARDGIYPAELMQKYTQNYLHAGGQRSFSEYYTARYDFAILRPTLQRNIVFSQHNLVSDAPFNEFNVILCRNVMIYFNRALQERTHQLFYDSLGDVRHPRAGVAGVAAVHAAGAPLRAARARREAVPADRMKTPELVAIGTSLGGLNALTALLADAAGAASRCRLSSSSTARFRPTAAAWPSCCRNTPG